MKSNFFCINFDSGDLKIFSGILIFLISLLNGLLGQIYKKIYFLTLLLMSSKNITYKIMRARSLRVTFGKKWPIRGQRLLDISFSVL